MSSHLNSALRVIELFKCAYDIYDKLPQEEKDKVDKFLDEYTGGVEDVHEDTR